MSVSGVISVQLDNCTDRFTTNENIFPSKTTHDPFQTHHYLWSALLAGLAHRTLHPLWQTWMQVRRYPRPWSQILSVGQLSQPQTRTRICATEIPPASRGFTHQLSDGQTDPGRDLEYQSRTAATERNVVKNAHGYSAELLYVVRNHGFCNPGSEYASGVVGRTIGRNRYMGGKR